MEKVDWIVSLSFISYKTSQHFSDVLVAQVSKKTKAEQTKYCRAAVQTMQSTGLWNTPHQKPLTALTVYLKSHWHSSTFCCSHRRVKLQRPCTDMCAQFNSWLTINNLVVIRQPLPDTVQDSDSRVKGGVLHSFIQSRNVKGTASQTTTLCSCLASGRVLTGYQRLPAEYEIGNDWQAKLLACSADG